MPNGETTATQEKDALVKQYERAVYNFLGDERYLRLDDEGRKEKLSMFFDKYTTPFLKRQGVEDFEPYRDQFIDKHYQAKKKEDSEDLSAASRVGVKPPIEKPDQFSIQSKTKEPEAQKEETDEFDSLDFESVPVPQIYTAERSSIPQIIPKIDLETIESLQEKKATQLEEHKETVNHAVRIILDRDEFKYIKEKPDVFLNNIENERKRVNIKFNRLKFISVFPYKNFLLRP